MRQKMIGRNSHIMGAIRDEMMVQHNQRKCPREPAVPVAKRQQQPQHQKADQQLERGDRSLRLKLRARPPELLFVRPQLFGLGVAVHPRGAGLRDVPGGSLREIRHRLHQQRGDRAVVRRQRSEDILSGDILREVMTRAVMIREEMIRVAMIRVVVSRIVARHKALRRAATVLPLRAIAAIIAVTIREADILPVAALPSMILVSQMEVQNHVTLAVIHQSAIQHRGGGTNDDCDCRTWCPWHSRSEITI